MRNESQKNECTLESETRPKTGERIFYDPERKDNILVRNENAPGIVGRVPQRPNCGISQSFEVRGEFVLRLTIGSRLVVELVLSGLWPRGLRHRTRDLEQVSRRKVWLFLDP